MRGFEADYMFIVRPTFTAISYFYESFQAFNRISTDSASIEGPDLSHLSRG